MGGESCCRPGTLAGAAHAAYPAQEVAAVGRYHEARSEALRIGLDLEGLERSRGAVGARIRAGHRAHASFLAVGATKGAGRVVARGLDRQVRCGLGEDEAHAFFPVTVVEGRGAVRVGAGDGAEVLAADLVHAPG